MKRLMVVLCVLGAFSAPAMAAAAAAAAGAGAADGRAQAPAAGGKVAATPPASKPVVLPRLTAAQIVEKNVAARGGLEAWRKVHSMQMTGLMDLGRLRKQQMPVAMTREQRFELTHGKSAEEQKDAGKVIQAPFVMDFERPHKVRVELQVAGKTAVQVYDGEHGWKLRPYLNRKDAEPFSPDEMKAAAQQQELDGPLIDYAAKGNKVELAGTDEVEGHGAYKLKVTLKTGDVRYVWIDGQSFLDVKIEGAPRRMDGRIRGVQTYMRDYKSVNGLMIPYVLETKVDRLPDSETITVQQVAVNPPIGDAQFAKP